MPARLRELLAGPAFIAPGCYDALTALLIERRAFRCAYVSGASIAFTRIARPDIGLTTLTEVAETVANMRERVTIPLIVDGDNGFGNALNVQRTVRLLERMGASAIQLEDQTAPKRCGHLDGKTLVPQSEMLGKIRAAQDARTDAAHGDHCAHRCDRRGRIRGRPRARPRLCRCGRRRAVR